MAMATTVTSENAKQHFAKKWDWDLAFALFVGGMTYKEISKQAQFRGCHWRTIVSKGAKDKWGETRKAVSETMGHNLARTLAERLAEAGDTHQEWLRQRLEKERALVNEMLITRSMDDQAKRLSNLRLIDDMTRRLTGLDDRKPLNATQNNLNITLHLASGHTPRMKGATAILGAAKGPSIPFKRGDKQMNEESWREAVSILRAKEKGIEYEMPTFEDIDIPIDEVDRSKLKPIAPLVNENKVEPEPQPETGPQEEAPDDTLSDEQLEQQVGDQSDAEVEEDELAEEDIVDIINNDPNGQFTAFEISPGQPDTDG